jgi:WhiB family redox-sensing transcriptional regulator
MSSRPWVAERDPVAAEVLSRDTDPLAWQDSALCTQTDPDAFFVEPEFVNEAYTKPTLRAIATARKICFACPVRAECGEYAIDGGLWYGIFGGLTQQERRVILRQREAQAA